MIPSVMLALALAAPAPGPGAQMMTRLQAKTPLVDDLQALTDTVGGRPTGSAAFDQAVVWAVSRLREAGLENVHTEDFAIAHGWLPRVETAVVIAPASAWETSRTLKVAGLPLSASTPAEGLEADVVDVGDGGAEGYNAAGARVKGRFVLVHNEPMKSIDDLFGEYMKTPDILRRAREGGAAGILWMSNRPGRLLYRHPLTLDGTVSPLPGAMVEREGAQRLARLLVTGQTVRVRLTSVGDTAPITSRNVVAEVKGTGPDVVMLGAHLDSWDLGRGALDNGCNVALVIDVARQAAALAREGWKPTRTLRFVLYGGEEHGLLGSMAEAHAHRDTLDHVAAQVIFDEGTGRTSGFATGGREDLVAAADAAVAPAAALGPFKQTLDAFVGTDNFDYMLEGVPTLVANQEGGPYLPDYHAESDTFDKADLVQLKNNAVIAGVVMAGLADAPSLPRRQTQAEIEALALKDGLADQMKVFGLWDPFVKGDRGRQP